MKILLFMVLPFLGSAQSLFIMQMDVKVVGRNADNCFEDITVVWGRKGDTIAFHYNEKYIRLWEFKERTSNDKKRIAQLRYQQAECPDSKFLYLKDEFEERWYARLDINEEGVVIYLSNLTVGKPHIMFNFTKYKICQE